MKRDIMDIDTELETYDCFTLNVDATDEKGRALNFINPSASKDYIYFRAMLASKEWISTICIFDKHASKFGMVDEHPECPNIEDLRIFDYQNRVWFVGFMRRSLDKIFETYVGYFNADCSYIEKIIARISSPTKHIKNITPLIHDNKLWLIDILTGTIYKHDDSTVCPSHTLDMSLIHESMAAYSNRVFGTTPYVNIQDTIYGGLIHITKKIGGHTCYFYKWIEIDVATWSVVFVSKPYVIQKLGIVFVSHIEKIGDDRFELMFGQDDENTCRCETSLRELRNQKACM